MTNKEIYKKTLTFSTHRLLYDLLAFLLMGLLGLAGFMIMDKTTDKGLIGLGVGLVIGLIVLVLILRYVSYTYKAGQIAMMTKAVTEGELPDNTLAAGKAIVKERFKTVAAYFAITGVIKGIFNQLGRGITAVGKSVGGDTGETVGNVISTVIQVIIAYLCDCCLGWVFYRNQVSAAKATCEGAVLFFKHGKTLGKNMGRVFGMGLVSFLLIGGAFFGAFYGIFTLFPSTFEMIAREAVEAGIRIKGVSPELMSDPNFVMMVCAGLAGIILWSVLHSVFVRPLVLVGVLRNYIESGKDQVPSEGSFGLLDSKSDKFRKLHAEIG